MNSVSDLRAQNSERQDEVIVSSSPRTKEQDITALFGHRQGEVFICNEDTHGLLECLPTFKGKMINALGGGYNKLYVIQDTEENEGIVSSLHPPEFDEYDAVFSQETTAQDPFEYLTAFDDKGTLRQIRAGRKHLLVLTDLGQIFSWGKGEYGALGLGGIPFNRTPKLVKSLADKVVIQIACGEYHSLALTDRGNVYAWGRGFEGQLGLAPAPAEKGANGTKQKYKKKKFDSTESEKVYAEDLDEEADGTSSLKKNQPLYNPGNIPTFAIQTVSSPKYVIGFFNNPIKYIACGAYHSLAINEGGQLYAWGENKLQQLGVEKPFKIDRPKHVQIFEQSLKDHDFNDSVLHMKISLKYDQADQKRAEDYLKGKASTLRSASELNSDDKLPKEARFKQVAGGFGHTIALTEEGDIYAWGFNMKGQLGIGDVARGHTQPGETKKVKAKLMKQPTRLYHDQLSNPLPKFQKIACGYYTSFAIDEKGHSYSWGGGAIGHKDEALQDVPRLIEAYTENRKFTDIFCTMKSTLFFAPIRVISMQPKSGPSSGGTIISLLGTGFTDTGNQKVRFSFGQYQTDVQCGFNPTSESLYCVTPKFDEFDEDGELWPLEVEVSLSLDGMNFIPAEEKFLIYNSNISIISMVPKNASVTGKATLTLDLNIDDRTAAKLKDVTIGFQAKKVDALGPSQTGTGSELDKMSKGASLNQSIVNSELRTVDRRGSFGSATPKAITSNRARQNQREAINPLGINVLSPELDKEDWIAVRGYYSSGGRVTCKIPQIDQLGEQNLFFNVDVSLNGQQFTGLPSSFRFYDIKVDRMSPNNDISEGNATIHIEGSGFIDSDAKKLKFVSQYTDPNTQEIKHGERLVDLTWIKDKKQFCFIVPPINWLFAGEVPTPEQIDELKHNPPSISLTLNSVEWLPIGTFFYFDPDFDRLAPCQPPESQEKWQSEEEEADPFVNCKNDNEIDKKKVELNKITAQEDDDIAHGYKKAGQYLWLRSKDFIQTRDLTVRFVSGNNGYPSKAVWKNQTRVGTQIPEIDDLPPGIHELNVELSYNGQQYSKTNKTLKYLAFDKNMSEADRKKFEDEEAKKLKVSSKKK